jgi:hypothetical protein
MAASPAGVDPILQDRASRTSLLLTSLGIIAFLLLLMYVLRHVSVPVVTNGGISSDGCTLFASPSGTDGNSGNSPSSAKSLSSVAALTRPGSVVCLLGGSYSLASSFKPTQSGTASSWIVYKNYGDSPVNFVWNGPADASAMFYFGGGKFPSKPAYLEFRGFNLDGMGNAADGFFCRSSHHLRFIGNSISNTGGSGIASIDCDYLTADHNLIYHNGYMPSNTQVPADYGWTSGISFNSARWLDSYPGFHNIISNNIIAGEYDGSSHHSDGNGIILDLSDGSYKYSSADTPPALVINNVVYGNGGRCVVAYVVTNFWIVNNTCYKNALDPELTNAGSLAANNSKSGFFINNIALGWKNNQPPYEQGLPNSEILYYSNMYSGSPNNFAQSEPSQLIEADPLFLNPPLFDPALPGQYATAPHPSSLGDGLTLRPTSPAIGKGLDPGRLPGLPEAIVRDLQKYIYTDIKGNRRTPGGPFDLGAYQFRHTQ